MNEVVPPSSSPVGLVAGGGILPFAVADSLASRGISVVIFPLQGFCDPERVKAYKHHWVRLVQIGRLTRLARAEGCKDLVFIGSLFRPPFFDMALDWGSIRVIAQLLLSFRGGDDHLLRTGSKIFEQRGFRLLGIGDVAPDLLMPAGCLTAKTPSETAQTDIGIGRGVLLALSPYDVGQAVVVIDNHVVAVEDIEGTDGLLARVARLRSMGRIPAKPGRGVLVKMPKSGQDLRFDLPAVGPRTIDGAATAGLAGIAVVAGHTLVAELQGVVDSADKAGLFVTGLSA